jgi:AcrR family transcriptional regulator
MSEVSRRTYDSTRRREQAARTRERIVEVAGRLFEERGYAGTTIPEIAREAGVAVETVYRSASGKAGLLADAVRAAVAGGVERAGVPVTERIAAERRHGLRTGLGRMLEQRGVLRDGVSAERAGDIVYALCGQANYVALVGDCGWAEAEYESWLAESLIAALLPRR